MSLKFKNKRSARIRDISSLLQLFRFRCGHPKTFDHWPDWKSTEASLKSDCSTLRRSYPTRPGANSIYTKFTFQRAMICWNPITLSLPNRSVNFPDRFRNSMKIPSWKNTRDGAQQCEFQLSETISGNLVTIPKIVREKIFSNSSLTPFSNYVLVHTEILCSLQ